MTLAEYITQNLTARFEWGKCDCVLFAAEWVMARDGVDILDGIPKWSTEDEARAILRKMGGLRRAIDARLARVPNGLAHDGDIALHTGGAAIYSGAHIVAPGHDGLVFLDRMNAKCSWRF